MRYSNLLGKTLKNAPKDATALSHKLLARAGFIDQLMAGVFTFLPLGWRVHCKIEQVIREEMNKTGAQEVFMPTLQKKSQWVETGRWETIDPPLFKFKDRHDRELALGPTHEEVITDIVRRKAESYRDLPITLYQIQNKFRNEMRPTGGLLRIREFVMKDLYSFHATKQGTEEYFEKVKDAYKVIFSRCGIPFIISQAPGGTIGGTTTYEFQVPSETGEDIILKCQKCGFAFNKEIGEKGGKEISSCPKCKGLLEEIKTIEVGHIFNLGTEYSEKMGATFTDKDGEERLIWMGCYGIGIGRLMATIVEVNNDENGIIWPQSVAPFKVHLLSLSQENKDIRSRAERTYKQLIGEGIEVLYDDREDVSPGEKFADADLIGIPIRLLISEKTGDKIEWSPRKNEEKKLIAPDKAIKELL